MTKREIQKLHRIAEFQKKLAWANYNCAKNSQLFKKELMDCAKQAANHCRETRRTIQQAIARAADRETMQTWLNAGAPGDHWD